MDQLLQALDALLQRILDYLDAVLKQIEKIRQYLVDAIEHIARFVERVMTVIRKSLRIVFSYILIFLPPVVGLMLALAKASPILAFATCLLIFLLLYAFLSKGKPNSATAMIGSPFSSSTKSFAILLLIALLVGSYAVHVDLLLSILLFVTEFIVAYLLRGSKVGFA